MGYREQINLIQLKSILEMESHEEKIKDIMARVSASNYPIPRLFYDRTRKQRQKKKSSALHANSSSSAASSKSVQQHPAQERFDAPEVPVARAALPELAASTRTQSKGSGMKLSQASRAPRALSCDLVSEELSGSPTPSISESLPAPAPTRGSLSSKETRTISSMSMVANAAQSSELGTTSSGQTKLSIYPASIPDLVLLDTPSALEKRIGIGIIDRWISVEEKVESRIKSFRDPTEPLNPGLLYTGISALTTSVLTRSRALPTRILLPPCSSSWRSLKIVMFPALERSEKLLVAHSGIAWERAKEGAAAGRVSVNNGVKSVVESIEQGTGLKLKAMGWAQEVKKEAQSVANVAQKDIKEAIESKSSSADS
ncbi:uncharacterized protein EDB91DRAFT_1244149 [Suillus paluster]|uniref:uncharacterized protein n=1 Tax=Suillus paluster TaxID=48578 RepID=UPI001B871F79|nr:uncharacterized protein EDB91DRAFT_1244149 [Suillus paluster]KAG1750565.1 hypothetical protein EDB91DRAFT_1244149 [Suillus paluster]